MVAVRPWAGPRPTMIASLMEPPLAAWAPRKRYADGRRRSSGLPLHTLGLGRRDAGLGLGRLGMIRREQHVDRRHDEQREERTDGDARRDHQAHLEARHGAGA